MLLLLENYNQDKKQLKLKLKIKMKISNNKVQKINFNEFYYKIILF